MIKITGLDEMARQLEEVEKAAQALDGEIELSFDPTDPMSIESAIAEMEAAVDQRTSSWPDNSMVADLAEAAKSKYREVILDRAAQARLKGGNADDE